MGATHTNHCHQNGRLVPAAEPIPDDPADYVWAPTVPGGCNALMCGSCGQRVAWRIADDRAGRVYSCSCSGKTVHARRWIDDWPADEFTDSVPSWHCGGHPVRTPPFELDGVQVDAAGFGPLIEAAAKGDILPSQLPAFLPPYALGWLERIAFTVAPEERQRFDRAATAALGTLPDGPLKALLDLVRLSGLPEATHRVVDGVAQGEARLAGPGLQVQVIAIVERAAGGKGASPSAIQAMRRLIDSPSSAVGGLVWPLAQVDADWLAAHSAKILEKSPDRGSHLFAALEAHAKAALPDAIDSALNAGVGRRADLERAIARAFEEPVRSRWLARLDSHPADP